MDDLISVIVPVYNSERYIGSCVESVLMQTYSLFELILIEDGSKDSSRKICEALCRKDTRIRLMKQDHRGVSAARNLGIEAAEGKYLFFLDSDDMIHPKLLESLYKLQEKNHTVIAVGGIQYDINDAYRKVARKTSVNYMPQSFYIDNKKALKNINGPILCGIGGKMISREAVDSLRFVEDLSHGEDTLFIYQLLVKGADLSVLSRRWYYYRIHGDNISRDYSPETCQDRYRVERYICQHEIGNRRRKNAIYIERDIVIMIAEWYEKGRASQNIELIRYTENLAKRERQLKIFHQLNWRIRIYFYLILYCYPLSRVGVRVFKNISIIYRLIERQKTAKNYVMIENQN